MIATTTVVVNGLEVLAQFTEAGYRVWLEGGEVQAEGPGPPSADLMGLVETHRDGLKAAILIATPPPWLIRMLNLYAGAPNPLQAETNRDLPRVTLKNLAAAVAASVGIPATEWERVLPEVEEHAGAWEPDRVVPLRMEGV